MALHHDAVGLTELIVRPGDKGLHGLHIHFLDAGQFSQFQNPVALQLLRSRLILHIRDGETVGVPLPPQQGEEGGLAHALGAVKHKDGVELDTGFIHTGDRSGECLSGDRPDIRGIIRTKVVDEQGIQPLGAVPPESGKVVLDGVILPLRRYHRQ